MEKRWSKTEIAHLKRHAATQSVEELANRFHTDLASVRSKLDSLNLTAQEGSSAEADAVMKQFEEALEKIHAKQWDDAKKLLETVVAQADYPQLADRARQYIEICLRQQEQLTSEDPYLLAVFEKNRGNLDEALEICKQSGDSSSERFAYLTASIQAIAGDEDAAIETLENAIRLEPKNRVHAYHDPDFRNLQGREEFNEMVGASTAPPSTPPPSPAP